MCAAPALVVLAAGIAAGILHSRRGNMKGSFPDVWTVEVAGGEPARSDRPAVGPTYRHLSVGKNVFPELETATTLYELFR